jgi:hypothetical protein
MYVYILGGLSRNGHFAVLMRGVASGLGICIQGWATVFVLKVERIKEIHPKIV